MQLLKPVDLTVDVSILRTDTLTAAAAGCAGTKLSPHGSLLSLNDLPVCVLADDLAVSKFVVITSADLDMFPGRPCARKQPFRKDHISTAPMTGIAVVDIWKTLKARRQSLPDRCLADETLSPLIWAARHVERTIVGKKIHDRV